MNEWRNYWRDLEQVETSIRMASLVDPETLVFVDSDLVYDGKLAEHAQADPTFCPVCAAHRARKAAAQRRWRAKSKAPAS